MQGVRISSLGSYFPRNKVGNDFFAGGKKPNPEGIHERRHAAADETSVFMGTQAGKIALERAGLEGQDIDGLICFTGMPDFEYPKDVNLIQGELGITSAAALSLDTACASFISSLKVGRALIKAGHHKRILILIIMNWVNRGLDKPEDFSTLGDGATGIILEEAEEDSLIGVQEITDPDSFDFLALKSPFVSGRPEYFEFSNDPRFGRYFVKGALQPARELLSGEVGPAEVDWFMAHQTGAKMLSLWTRTLKLPTDSNLNTFDMYGNMSAVNIPATLDHYVNVESRVKRGDTLFFFAPGAGMHLAAMLWKY